MFHTRSAVAAAVIAIGVVLTAGWGIKSYNRLVALDQQVDSQWGQVQNVYQRRLDLVPNLVQTVRAAAAFERETFTQVAEARSRAGQVLARNGSAPEDPGAIEEFQQAQDGLGSALSRLMVVVERYPEVKATAAFRDLMTQLEGTENRIAIERMRFNEVAAKFNTYRQRFPTVLIANAFGGSDLQRKAYFRAQAGAESAPRVEL